MKKITVLFLLIFLQISCTESNNTENNEKNTPKQTKEETIKNDSKEVKIQYLIDIKEENISNKIQLRGTIKGNIDKVEIVWKNGINSDSYFLKKFKKGDQKWLTNLKVEYGNILEGTNEYIINGYISDKIVGVIKHEVIITTPLKYKCEININNVQEKYYDNLYSDFKKSDIRFKNKNFIIKNNDFSCIYDEYHCDNKNNCKMDEGYGTFFMDGKEVTIRLGFAEIDGKTCGYIETDKGYIDMGKNNKDIRTILKGSKNCNDLAIATTYKNIEFTMNNIDSIGTASQLADKLEKLIGSLKLEKPILDIKGNQFFYESETINRIETIELRDLSLYNICGKDNLGNCTINKVENNKIYWSSSIQNQGYGIAKYYETNPIGVTKLINEESWSPED